MTDPALKAAVERVTALADHYNRRAEIMGRFADQCAASDDYKPVADADADREHQVAADLRALLAAHTDAQVEIIGLRADLEAAHTMWRSKLSIRDAALSSQASVMEEMASALTFYANGFDWSPGDGEAPDATHPGSPPTFYEADATGALIDDAGEIARTALSQYRTLGDRRDD